MTKTRTTLGALVLGIALATPSAGQDGTAASDGPWAWLGSSEGKWATPEGTAAQVAQARTWLADLRVGAQTGHLPADWEAQLNLFRAYGTSVRQIPNQEALAVEAALARAEVLHSLGRFQESLEATHELLLSPTTGVIAADPARFGPAPARIVEAAARWGKNPRLAAKQTELRRLLAPQDQGLGDLEEILRANIKARNFELVIEIGARAVPLLEEAVLADMDEFPNHVTLDPLFYLMKIAERRAAILLLQHMQETSYALRQRTLRAMDALETLDHSDDWGERASDDAPAPCLIPEWTSVLAAFVRDPDSAREAMSRVWNVVNWDGLTTEMSDALAAAFDAGNPDLASDMLQMLGRIRGRKYSTKGLLEHLLGDEDPNVRRFAADKLLYFPENAALLARFTDPDPAVRATVARSLRWRNMDSKVGEVIPTIDENAVKVINRLLQDEDHNVRSLAVRALLDLEKPVEAEMYRLLLRDKNPDVREQLAWLTHPDDELMSELLLALAGDAEPSIIDAMDDRFAWDETWTRPPRVPRSREGTAPRHPLSHGRGTRRDGPLHVGQRRRIEGHRRLCVALPRRLAPALRLGPKRVLRELNGHKQSGSPGLG